MSIRARVKAIRHLRNRHLICVLENPKLPANLAGTIRNVCALGVEKIYVTGGYKGMPKTFEGFRNNHMLQGASVGASKWTFVKWFETPEECVSHLRKKGYKIAVTSPHLKGKKNVSLYDGDFTQKQLAVWFGNESQGIGECATQNSDLCIQIPMGGIVESFNLATSTGIVLSFIREQRLKIIQANAKKKTKLDGTNPKKQ